MQADLHATGHADEGLAARDVRAVDERVVEGRVDVAHTDRDLRGTANPAAWNFLSDARQRSSESCREYSQFRTISDYFVLCRILSDYLGLVSDWSGKKTLKTLNKSLKPPKHP